ncbi:hypothetical protein [Maridesulfovibrio sp.]|uniref:hypothetical protein n=1 Tax=Maridesulfovibrio sp. TaxID=2795000 RepID=UPI002A18CC8E|nr:hypothetical protein [Maridesulfovibrio sp.]
MDVINDIANWVEKKPLILISFDEADSHSLLYSRRGLEHITFTRRHDSFKNFRTPTFCLVEFIDDHEVKLFIGVVARKRAVSTLESRLTLTGLQRIVPNSFEELSDLITISRFYSAFMDKIPVQNATSMLSPKLSSNIIEILAEFPENINALNNTVSQIPKLRPTPNKEWAQENAIKTALNAFGIDQSYKPEELTIKTGQVSGLSKYGEHVLEDNVLIDDARQFDPATRLWTRT